MSTPNQFPVELLTQPKVMRWRYFYHKLVAHPHLIETHRSLKEAIRYATRGRLILVFGPTGVGKTTLRQGIERSFMDESGSELAQDPGHIPIASMATVSPELGHFDWKDFYTRALIALNEPLVQAKLPATDPFDSGISEVRCREDGQLIIQTGLTLRKLRQAYENCLHYRRPLAFISDDAHHLQKIAGGRRLRDQMDAIKSLAERSETVHVLIGTYELLNLTNLSDQLSRRSYHLCFPRYRADDETDVAAFKSVLQSFQHHLPLPQMPDLVGQWEYMYEHCAGCIGILKLWLCDALAAALEQEEKTLNPQRLQRQTLPPDQLMNIIREILEGERKVAAIEEQRAGLRQALGLPPQVAALETVRSAAPAPPEPRRRRIGERTPRRDPIGRSSDD